MNEILTKSAFAAKHGVGVSAVSNWIARDKITGAALTPDGRIVVAEAERQLALSVDPGRGAPRAADLLTPMPQQVVQSPATPLAEMPDPGSLAGLRIRKETLAVEEAERQAAIRRGELVRADEVTRRFGAALDDLLAAVELFVLDLPVKLGCDREEVELARREWRAFRLRRAAQARPSDDDEVARAA